LNNIIQERIVVDAIRSLRRTLILNTNYFVFLPLLMETWLMRWLRHEEYLDSWIKTFYFLCVLNASRCKISNKGWMTDGREWNETRGESKITHSKDTQCSNLYPVLRRKRETDRDRQREKERERERENPHLYSFSIHMSALTMCNCFSKYMQNAIHDLQNYFDIQNRIKIKILRKWILLNVL